MLTGTVLAAVSADEAKQLGGPTLTLFGAEKAGNKDGTIPEYTGGGIKAPASYDPKNPWQHPDPFNEKPLFSITAKNMAQYAERLTEGQKALFKAYPNWRMDVYPTHRTAQFPKYVLDNTVKNATSCKATDNELRLEGCYGGLPFPIPKTGNQAMWNHMATYQAHRFEGNTANWMVPPTGAPVLQAISHASQELPYYDPERTGVNNPKDTYWQIHTHDSSPARRADEQILIVDALDQIGVGRRAWQYIPGQRRVKLAPDLSYDTPNPYTGGAGTMDDANGGFMGGLDRFEWKLIGKQEKYIVYNTYNIVDNKVCPDEKLTSTKNFVNPDCLRWELHRVWVVTGTLKPGFRHIYAKRTLYWDEDGFNAGQGENYDAGGKLFRVVLPLHWTFYESIGTSAGSAVIMDMNTGIYAAQATGTCKDGCGYTTSAKPRGKFYFSPEAMAGAGLR